MTDSNTIYLELDNDPSDPRVIMHTTFVQDMARIWLEARKATVFREMTVSDQVNAYVNGALSGMIAMGFSKMTDEGRESFLNYVRAAVDVAGRNAEVMLEDYREQTEKRRH